jgi:hypothetical protein
MRVYLPTTLPALATARAAGAFLRGVDGVPAHAVTAAVREWYIEGDLEELEYSALVDAAEASLRLLARDPTAPRRRVVAAVDVPEGAVTAGGPFRSSVTVGVDVAIVDVVSVHVDEDGATATVAEAIAALPAADAGDDDARFLLDEAEALDLLWFDVSEVSDLL